MKILRLILIVLITQNVIAQQKLTKTQVESLPNTIENQFTKIYRLSNNWQEYKMIKRNRFVNFQKNILDSISSLKTDINNKQTTINSQIKDINTLKSEITTLKESLTSSVNREDSINFFGTSIKKGTYNTILWGTISVLVFALSFFIFKYNNSSSVTNEAKNLLFDVENEFEQHKKKAIEREQKLRRQLQDEINKQRGV